MDNGYNILLFVESRYKVNRKRIKKTTINYLKEQGISGPVEVSIAVIGDRKMRMLHNKYKGEDKTTNVLSFPLSEGGAMVVPSDILRLGDIVISYPKVIEESADEEMMVDDKVDELVVHSINHLLGDHHG